MQVRPEAKAEIKITEDDLITLAIGREVQTCQSLRRHLTSTIQQTIFNNPFSTPYVLQPFFIHPFSTTHFE